MTLNEFNTILESKLFKSTRKGRIENDNFKFRFKESSIYRQESDSEEIKICDYTLIADDFGFKMNLINIQKGIWPEFRNVKVISGNIIEWINIEHSRYTSDENYEIILESI